MRIYFIILFIITGCFSAIGQQNCPSWASDIDSIKMMRHRDVYRKHTEEGRYQEAVYFWEYIYERAPGGFEQFYIEGVEIYKKLYELEGNLVNKKFYKKKIFSIYDKRAECYPDNAGNILARKAYEMYSLQANELNTFTTMSEVIRLLENKTPSYLLSPYAKVTASLVNKGKLSFVEGDKVRKQLSKIANFHIILSKDETYQAALANIQYHLGNDTNDVLAFVNTDENSTTPADCAYFIEKYKEDIDNAKDDKAIIQKAYNNLKQIGCTEGEQYMANLLARLDNPNVDFTKGNTSKSSSHISKANDALKMGKYEDAISYYLKAINEKTTEEEKKADYYYQVASIYYVKLKKHTMARYYAYEALNHRPNWGKPYTFIGDMYIASMKTCYPTDKVMQKIVLVAAMDKWQIAVDIDRDETAIERIKKYRGYLPTKSEIFLHGTLKEGRSVRLECWIKEKVNVRVQ